MFQLCEQNTFWSATRMLGLAFISSHIHVNSQHSDLKQQLAPALFSGLAVHCNAKCCASIYECSHRRGAACTSHRACCVNTCFLYIHMFCLDHIWAQYFDLVKVIAFHLQVSYYSDVYSICPSKRSWLHKVNSDAPHHCWTTSLHPTPIVICVLYSNPWLTIMPLRPFSDLQPSVTTALHREMQPIQLGGEILCLLLATCALCSYSNHQPGWSLGM